MADATFTLTKVVDYTAGNKRYRVRNIACDGGNYAASGLSLTPAMFGLDTIQEFRIHGVPTDGTVAYPASYNYTTQKIWFWESGAANAGLAEKGVEAMTSVTFRVTAVGY